MKNPANASHFQSAMTQPGHEPGMTVVARGVEEQARIDAPEETGIDAIPGYIHVHPMPEETFSDWFQHRRSP